MKGLGGEIEQAKADLKAVKQLPDMSDERLERTRVIEQSSVLINRLLIIAEFH